MNQSCGILASLQSPRIRSFRDDTPGWRPARVHLRASGAFFCQNLMAKWGLSNRLRKEDDKLAFQESVSTMQEENWPAVLWIAGRLLQEDSIQVKERG